MIIKRFRSRIKLLLSRINSNKHNALIPKRSPAENSYFASVAGEVGVRAAGRYGGGRDVARGAALFDEYAQWGGRGVPDSVLRAAE